MAENRFRGDAQAVAQVYTATFAAPVGVNDVYTVTRNQKDITTLSSAPTTAAATATAFAEKFLSDSGVIPEFAEMSVTDSGTGVLTFTGVTLGNPFTLTATANITLAVVTAATGPEDLGNAENWTLGFPVNGQDLTWPADKVRPVKWNLTALSAVTPAIVRMPVGTYGLPDWNDAGYQEDRAKVMILAGATRVEIGSQTTTPDYVRLKITAGSAVIRVVGGQVGGVSSEPVVRLISNAGATHAVELISGIIGLGYDDEIFQCATCTIGTKAINGAAGSADSSPTVFIGAAFTCAVAVKVFDGQVYSRANGKVFMSSGSWTQQIGNCTELKAYNGSIFRFDSDGILGTAGGGHGGAGCVLIDGPDSMLDLSGSTRTFTFNADFLEVYSGAKPIDPHKRKRPINVATDQDSVAFIAAGDVFDMVLSN